MCDEIGVPHICIEPGSEDDITCHIEIVEQEHSSEVSL